MRHRELFTRTAAVRAEDVLGSRRETSFLPFLCLGMVRISPEAWTESICPGMQAPQPRLRVRSLSLSVGDEIGHPKEEFEKIPPQSNIGSAGGL